VDGTELEGLAPDGELELALPGWGQLLEEGVELGDEEAIGDTGEEGWYEGLEGEEGPDGVLAAVVDGLDGEVEVVGELIGCAEDGVDELVEVIWRERVGVLAGTEGIEVAGGGARLSWLHKTWARDRPPPGRRR